MSKQSTLQKFLGTLKTAQKLTPRALRHEVSTTISENPIEPSSVDLFSELNSSTLHLILSDRYIHSSTCLRFFQFLLDNHSSLPFEPDLSSHLILICRLLKATNFAEAENLLKSVAVEQIQRYPFPDIASCIEGCSVKSRTREKFFNCLLKIYSDNGLFDEATTVFEYAKDGGFQVNEKTCTILLFALKRSDQIRSCLEFFYRMVESGMEVSVYSLTIAVGALCSNGDIKMGRELVEEMSRKGVVKPNVVTFNILIAACAKRWNFVELDLVLALMKEEEVGFNLETYKFLIDGCTSSGKAGEAKRLLLEMHEKGLKVDTHLCNLIIGAYCRSGSMDSACQLFDEMGERGVVRNSDTYWGLVSGLCKAGEMDAVKGYMDEMEKKGVKLDQDMLEKVAACSGKKRVVVDEAAPECQDLMVKGGFHGGGRPRGNKREEIKSLLVTMRRFNRS